MHAFIVFALVVSLQKIHGNKNVNFVRSADDNGQQRQQVQHPPATINQAYLPYDPSDERTISAATDSQSATMMPPPLTSPSSILHVNENTEPEPLQLTL